MLNFQVRRSWLIWIVVNIAGGTLGGVFVGWLGADGDLLFGVCAGVAQWLVLRRLVGVSGWWIIATAVGSFLAFVTSFADFFMGVLVFYVINLAWRLLQFPTNQPTTGLLLGGPFTAHLIAGVVTLPSGALIGFLQQKSQPRFSLERIPWVWLSAAGTGVAVAISGIELLDPSQNLGGLVFQIPPGAVGTLFGLAYGAITGYGVTKLITLRRTG